MPDAPVLLAGRYRLGESLGRGGMGQVLLARDETLERDVAIKELYQPFGSDGAASARRTLREARAAARISHPNVVQVYDVLQLDDRTWIVMEYVPCRSLREEIAEQGPLDPYRVAQIGLDLLGALRTAHRLGVEHRDVKPANVLLTDDGRVLLTDFGIAAVDDDGVISRSDVLVGSPQFMAPERARTGASGPAADLWSLGATLYAAVEGRAPYERGSTMATLTALTTEEPDPPQRAGAVRPLLDGLLRKDPATRMNAEDAEALARAIITGTSGDEDGPAGDRPAPTGLAGFVASLPAAFRIPRPRPSADSKQSARAGDSAGGAARAGAAPAGRSSGDTPPIDTPRPGTPLAGTPLAGTRRGTGDGAAAVAAAGAVGDSVDAHGPDSAGPDAVSSVGAGTAGEASAGDLSAGSPATTGPDAGDHSAEPDEVADGDPSARARDAGPGAAAGAAAGEPDGDRADAADVVAGSGGGVPDADRADAADSSRDDASPVTGIADDRDTGIADEPATGIADDPESSPDAVAAGKAGASAADPPTAVDAGAAVDSDTRIDEPVTEPVGGPVARGRGSVPAQRSQSGSLAGAKVAGTGTDQRRRRLVAVAAGLAVVVAAGAVWAANLGGGDSPEARPTPTAVTASAGPTASAGVPPVDAVQAPPPSMAASAEQSPSPSPSTSTNPGPGGRPPVPAGWMDYTDPTGFSVYVPASWKRSRDGTMVYFRGDGKVLGIDQTNRPKSDPVADWESQRDFRRSRGDWSGYADVKIVKVSYFRKAADWEFTFDGDGGRRHVNNRGAVISDKKAYGFYWETADAVWEESLDDLDLVFDSFIPAGS